MGERLSLYVMLVYCLFRIGDTWLHASTELFVRTSSLHLLRTCPCPWGWMYKDTRRRQRRWCSECETPNYFTTATSTIRTVRSIACRTVRTTLWSLRQRQTHAYDNQSVPQGILLSHNEIIKGWSTVTMSVDWPVFPHIQEATVIHTNYNSKLTQSLPRSGTRCHLGKTQVSARLNFYGSLLLTCLKPAKKPECI